MCKERELVSSRIDDSDDGSLSSGRVGCLFHWNRIDPDSNNLCQIFMSLFHLIKRCQIILRSFLDIGMKNKYGKKII